MKSKNKKGQILGMPFQMLFSILLIAVFIVAAVIVVRNMLERASQAKVALFANELQSKITETWYATEAQKSFKFELPSKVEWICFGNLTASKAYLTGYDQSKKDEAEAASYANKIFVSLKESYAGTTSGQTTLTNLLMLWPPEYVKGLGLAPVKKIKCENAECLDLSGLPNPYCIKNTKTGFSITLVKELRNRNVKIVKP
jgi:hypothetical protein